MFKAVLTGWISRWQQFLRRGAIASLIFTLTWLSLSSVAMAAQELPLAYAAGGNSAVAAATPSDTLDGTLDQFLRHIPQGFYGILDVNLLKTRLKEPDLVLIDVREPLEYLAGHIDGAINIPLRTLAQNLEQIPKDKEVVLYCSSGYRTGMGVMTLHLLGYDNVKGFPPSYQGWVKANE